MKGSTLVIAVIAGGIGLVALLGAIAILLGLLTAKVFYFSDLTKASMSAGYPSAFDNAAQYLLREGKHQEAEGLLRRGVQLEDPDAMVSLADAIRAGWVSPHVAGGDFMLYGRAAKLGHQGAKNTVDRDVGMQIGNGLMRAIGR
ncbi:hypothetical protein [Bradyrhizobium sp. CCGE-LA001]|uniref:hypothetical protein n=1 Tax=Bradyrhizobium sp. CCGE-LA001 TaxID=1223566 RepID=UPI0002AA83D2|nr:hypothetical protein [Bradyrhizobium sp. CCGE-LA001]AMA60110.1 hypothetical protein BCCGELA001_30320 [Bradyrhizobium sp. CCGE-LA001]